MKVVVVMMTRIDLSILEIEDLSPFSYQDVEFIGMIILALDILSSPKANVTMSYTFVTQCSVHKHLKMLIKMKKE